MIKFADIEDTLKKVNLYDEYDNTTNEQDLVFINKAGEVMRLEDVEHSRIDTVVIDNKVVNLAYHNRYAYVVAYYLEDGRTRHTQMDFYYRWDVKHVLDVKIKERLNTLEDQRDVMALVGSPDLDKLQEIVKEIRELKQVLEYNKDFYDPHKNDYVSHRRRTVLGWLLGVEP